MEIYKSTAPEIEGVPMTDQYQYTYWTAYCVRVPDLKPGDEVDIKARFQVNNPNDYGAQITYFIGRGSGFGILHPVAVDPVFPVGGEDVAGHGHFNETCEATDTKQTGSRYYSLYLQTASTDVKPGAALVLVPIAGGIEAIVRRAPV